MVAQILENPPAPGSPEWRRVISASKVPAILGLSRFTSQYATWHEMAGLVEPEPVDEDRMAWGHIAELSLAEWWKAKNPGWLLNSRRAGSAEITYTDPDLPFPNLATIDRRALNRSFGFNSPERFHIVECKTAVELSEWGRPGDEDSVPADYFTQVMFQMGVSGIHRASIVVLGGFQDPEIHPIEFEQNLFDGIVDELVLWEESLLSGVAPALDDSLATYETVRGLHPDIDPKGVVEISRSDAVRLLDAAVAPDEAKAGERAAKMEIMELMGSAKLLKCGGVKIADRRSKSGGKPYVQFNKKADLSEVES